MKKNDDDQGSRVPRSRYAVDRISAEPRHEVMPMIHIQKSETADTRTCDYANVTKATLLASSEQHIADVREALQFFRLMLLQAAEVHDPDKLTDIDGFHADFVTGFVEHGWWDRHRQLNRHHLTMEDGIPADVNLVDVLDFIADCVMAGMARSGSVYPLNLPPALLERAFQNTVELLKSQVTVDAPEAVDASDPHVADPGNPAPARMTSESVF